MGNLVLYRKYRPKSFSEVMGQEHIVKVITNAISGGEVSHAYLFSGPRGSGKTTIARLLAKAVNCEERKNGFEPCNKCQSCIEIGEGKSLDLIEIDAASNRGIDEMRELRDGIKFSPVRSKYKVFVIDEAHQLTKEAANALLKTLEEPPSHAIFILATTESHKILATIASRCQHFDFKKLSFADIIKKLEFIAKAEGVKIEKPALELIAKSSDGSIRDAESLFDQVITLEDKNITIDEVEEILGVVEFSAISKFVDLIIRKDESGAIRHLNELVENGYDLQQFCKVLVGYLRELLIASIDMELVTSSFSGHGEEEIKVLQGQSKSFKEEQIKNILKIFIKAENEIRHSSLQQLPLELAIVESIALL